MIKKYAHEAELDIMHEKAKMISKGNWIIYYIIMVVQLRLLLLLCLRKKVREFIRRHFRNN